MKPCTCITNLQVYVYPCSDIVLEIQNRRSHELFIIIRCIFVHFKTAPLYGTPVVQLISNKFLKGLGHSNVLKFKSFILILDFRLDCLHSFVYMYFSFINIYYMSVSGQENTSFISNNHMTHVHVLDCVT